MRQFHLTVIVFLRVKISEQYWWYCITVTDSDLTEVGLALHRAGGYRGNAEDLVSILSNDPELIGLSLSQGGNSEESVCHIGVVTLEPAALTGQCVRLTLNDVAHNGTATIIQWS